MCRKIVTAAVLTLYSVTVGKKVTINFTLKISISLLPLLGKKFPTTTPCILCNSSTEFSRNKLFPAGYVYIASTHDY